jgi:Lipid A 3-O-deacylase (PagL)
MSTRGVSVFTLIVIVLISTEALGKEFRDQGSAAQDWVGQATGRPAGTRLDSDPATTVPSSSQPFSVPQSNSGQATNKFPDTGAVAEFPHGPARNQATRLPSTSSGYDFNRETFYKNKLELGLEVGALPINTPMLVGPIFGYTLHRPRKRWAAFYTLVPTIVSLRWQLYNPMGPWFLRGNTEFTFGATYTAITEGRESVFAGPVTGARYNFVQPNWKLVPYADLQVGLGYTDAYQPYQLKHHLRTDGQGQDFTFTFLMSAGFRYNFNQRYSATVGFMAMHISNMYLSEPKYYNHGINVIGPAVGFNIGLNDLFHRSRE